MRDAILKESLDGLQEDLLLELAYEREIIYPQEYKTTLEGFYNRLADPSIPHSYAGFSPHLAIGFAELHGLRYAQEDRIAFGAIAGFEKLSESKRSLALQQTIATLADIAAQSGMDHIGSTLCATVLFNNHIYTANVGDSAAYLVVLDQENYISQFKRLNIALHHPTEPAETTRLQLEGKDQFIRFDRLKNLAVSRAIGDTALVPYGLSHTADTYHDQVRLPPNGKAFVIVACDGLTEPLQNTEMDIALLLQRYQQQNMKEIAVALAEQAFITGSTDNISVLVTQVDPCAKLPKYMAVFDGHGGVECADLLRSHFHPVLKETIVHLSN